MRLHLYLGISLLRGETIHVPPNGKKYRKENKA